MSDKSTEELLAEQWWREDGRFIDPDTDDVPWEYKRAELAQISYIAGFKKTHPENSLWAAKLDEVTRLRHELDRVTGERDALRDALAESAIALNKVGHAAPVYSSLRSASGAIRQHCTNAALKALSHIPQPSAPAPESRDWSEDLGHENGNYQCWCTTCRRLFTGHKRRVTCRACAAPEGPKCKVCGGRGEQPVISGGLTVAITRCPACGGTGRAQ